MHGFVDHAHGGGGGFAGLAAAEEIPDVTVFHAGTALSNTGEVVTAGGRVLGVTARAASLREATDRAYQAVARISFDGMQFRSDIGRS